MWKFMHKQVQLICDSQLRLLTKKYDNVFLTMLNELITKYIIPVTDFKALDGNWRSKRTLIYCEIRFHKILN